MAELSSLTCRGRPAGASLEGLDAFGVVGAVVDLAADRLDLLGGLGIEECAAGEQAELGLDRANCQRGVLGDTAGEIVGELLEVGAGTWWFTKPLFHASVTGVGRAVKNISLALFTPMWLMKWIRPEAL
jgi:hypothetical protein